MATSANEHNLNGGLSISADRTLYVSTDAPGGAGDHDIYRIELSGGADAPMVLLAGAVNTEARELAPFVSSDESFLVFTTSSADEGLRTLVSRATADGEWDTPRLVPVINDYDSKFAGLSPDGTALFFVSHRQTAESNPEAIWDLGLFGATGLEDSADLYWIDVGGLSGALREGASRPDP